MWQIEKEFSVRLGGNTYINTPNLIEVQGESLFRVYRSDSDGILGIDFDVYNSSGAKAATVRKGIVVEGDESNYDISSGMKNTPLSKNQLVGKSCQFSGEM